ncbi:deoxyribodipyrimidine photo-lyase [Chlorobaculum sp. 24CR]|uniref:deoxyribodipyrimidine photo-lyase n=1 Tax=Chlorobaculum sp. 24CR TaxID=2508878 RepID=UPI00100AF588|nr:deoxyribodipyrimidine photo-lyase [Chlorobaculum sp. 24CR]RXK84784.1 deoxyribodipyrimidine photo-lyase [Chlorobaculum sp. 24CR]
MNVDQGIDQRRARRLNLRQDQKGPVIYWMSRDQRFQNNWALLFACRKARQLQQPLEVVFTLAPSFLGAPLRHYDFMFKGLAEAETSLRNAGIPMTVLFGNPEETMPDFVQKRRVGLVVSDFSPLKLVRQWKRAAAAEAPCAFYEVDAHNIVPCWLASPKQEYAARTIRPRLDALRRSFLTPFPEPVAFCQPASLSAPPVNWDELLSLLDTDHSVRPVSGITPGEAAAEQRWRSFLAETIERYDDYRNDPNAGAVSGLSPYLHFGQISAQHVAFEASQSLVSQSNLNAFIEELFIRRELSDNYCFYNEQYDTFDGLPAWAKTTLMEHAEDHRDYIYTPEQFEKAQTHDLLWNAAQLSLVETGLIHGYMRMYWAKKILEWSPTPMAAFDIAVMLNDRYALDGRDPNGYVGVAWSIGGLHDRPWSERPVYGKIRYMNASGCARKFDVSRYISTMNRISQTTLF